MPENKENENNNGNGDTKKTLAFISFVVKHWKSIGILAGFLWAVYTEYNRYMETGSIAREMQKDYQFFKDRMVKDTVIYSDKFIRLDKGIDSLKKIGKDLKEYEAKFNYLQNRTKYDSIDLNLVYIAIKHLLDDNFIGGVKFKKAKDGTLFYQKGSLLYIVAWDASAQKYYYYADDGKTYWCE